MPPDTLERYELLTQVSEGSVRTYHALARTGAVVMVHFLDRAPVDHGGRAAALIERLPPEERRRVIEVKEVDGATAVVTKFVLDFDSFFGWLEPRAGFATDADSAPPATPPQSGPGEFTLAFQQPTTPSPSAPPLPDPLAPRQPDHSAPPLHDPLAPPPPDHSAPPPATEVHPVPPAGAVPPGEPGEFTRTFLSMGDPLGGGMGAPEAGPPQAPPEAAGEFTRAFRAQNETSPEAPVQASPPAPPAETEGEFTRAFRALREPEPAKPLPGTPVPADPPRPVPGDPPLPISPVPDPPLPEDPRQPPPAPYPGTPPPPPSPPTAGGDQEPGEFTRMFRAVKDPSAGAAPPSTESRMTQAPAPGAPGTSQPSTPPAPSVPPTGSRAPLDLPAPDFGTPAPPPAQPPRTPELKWHDETVTPPAGPPGAGGGPAASTPGEFTKIFGRAETPGRDPLAPRGAGPDFRGPDPTGAPLGQADADYLSRLTNRPAEAARGSGPATPSVTPPAATPQTPAPGAPTLPQWLGGPGSQDLEPAGPVGPSEFTRVVAAQTPPPAPPQAAPAPVIAPPPAQAAPAAPPAASSKLLLGGIVVIVVLTLALILFFVLWTPTAPADPAAEEAPTAAEQDSV